MEKIILGLPKGSLNNVNRGNTYQLFVDAGYEVRGYEPGKEENEITILNDPEIKGFLTRPQSAPVELNRQILDLAIIGEDWVREESVNLKEQFIKKVGDLDYGQTRLIVAVPSDDPYESLSEFFRANKGRENPILCFTEYPNLTRQFFMENDGYQELFGESKPLVQVRGLWDGDNEMVQIINSDGATEVYIAKGADLVVDNTQTGSSLRKAGLKILETIMESSAGLYAGPSCTQEKAEKARIIFEQLFGAIKARKYFDVKFNIANQKLDPVKDFLMSNEYCSDEPTAVKGSSFSQVNVLIPKNKFPEMLKGIKSFGASAIVRENVKQYVQ
ncbi:ATP phosphoribosyltransferase [Methanobacterium sp. MZ-A1]|jgi:ATP phosphoribosyltransferase|uniref:ATP phosphoribosyltransferase n=1 Tax=Methanobacterium sp. MZ-A1 TaxID=1911685 RepID=UPI000C2D63AC|nr:ATP phosphoribosyltransferase [Methanobacterium sp. MZ-A1]AUB58581.1 ATP phosphoribosyltransferase [Methanobacterium sp. MZ-A1]